MKTLINQLNADVLVVGGGTGGTAAALQAARRGANTILISDFTVLGGMLTTAGVSAPDGNELLAFQTGLWGAFLQALRQQQPQGLDHGWVSFFTFDPRIGAKIFADWVQQEANLRWISGYRPLEVLKRNNRVTGVRFADFTVKAKITLDATELGDLLALAEVPYRWGWEFQSQWQEPSAPIVENHLTQNSAIQAPTWVAILQDFGSNALAPEIPAPPVDTPDQFVQAWEGYGAEKFLNYGRLPGQRMMINWPCHGNDYGQDLDRLIHSDAKRQEFWQECRWHTQSFVRFIQTQLGRRYGLAPGIFPVVDPNSTDPVLASSFALHPYYRESRRLQGVTTLREQDILPIPGGQVAPLPLNSGGECDAIAIGNYVNDHHYTCGVLPLKPKYLRWGGRWSGTPFTIPYRSLIPVETEGLLVCEKNISVSHIANGATRLQPVVLGIGQAAGMAAALCIESQCQPRELPVKRLQQALLNDPTAAAAVIPFFNLPPDHPDWIKKQWDCLNFPENYPENGEWSRVDLNITPQNPLRENPTPNVHQVQRVPMLTEVLSEDPKHQTPTHLSDSHSAGELRLFSGIFDRNDQQDYSLTLTDPIDLKGQTWKIVTLHPDINQHLQYCSTESSLNVKGRLNYAGYWLIVEAILEDLS